MTRDVYPKTRSSAWFRKQRNSRQRTMPTETVSKPRTVWRTTATHSSLPSLLKKLQERSPKTKRRTWMLPLRTPSPGWMLTQLPRRKNMKRSKSRLKELLCPFFSKWQVVPEACQVACQVDPCPTWEAWEGHHHRVTWDMTTQLEAQPLKKLIKQIEAVVPVILVS